MIQNQIIKQDSVSPYAIACASDRNIKGLETMLKGYLNHESTALSTASAIALLANDPNHKESKHLIEKTFRVATKILFMRCLDSLELPQILYPMIKY